MHTIRASATKVVWGVCACVGLFAAVGCQTEQYARDLVAKSEDRGILAIRFYPTGEEMVDKRRITAHRVIQGAEDTPIDVWVIRARGEDGAPAQAKATMLLLHAHDQNKASFPILGAAERLAKKGYDVVLPDLRAHGRSGGAFVTYGAKEKHDLKAVLDALIVPNGVHPDVYVFGVNLGAAAGIQYAAMDERVKGLLAVSPYMDFPHYARYRYVMLSPEDFQATLEAAAEMGDFDPADTSTVKAAMQVQAPMVILHGLLDASSPVTHAEAVYTAAAGPKKFLVPGPSDVLRWAILEDWVAAQMDHLATRGLPEGLNIPGL